MWRASGTIPWSSPHLPTRPPGRKYTPAGATPIQFFSASVTPVYSWFFSTGSEITRSASRNAFESQYAGLWSPRGRRTSRTSSRPPGPRPAPLRSRSPASEGRGRARPRRRARGEDAPARAGVEGEPRDRLGDAHVGREPGAARQREHEVELEDDAVARPHDPLEPARPLDRLADEARRVEGARVGRVGRD